MAVYNDWNVEYLHGSTWTAIGDVVALNIEVGRRAMPDQWGPSSAVVTLRYPSGWATPLANLTSGTSIRVFAPGRSATKPSWTGVVSDLQFSVGIPWNSGTQIGQADELTITAEGYLATAGRYIKQVGWPTPTIADDVTIKEFVETQLNSRAKLVAGVSSSAVMTTSEFFPFDYTGIGTYFFIPADAIQQVAAFSLVRIVDGVKRTWSFLNAAGALDDPAMFVGDPAGYSTVATVGFSDTANNSTNRVFDDVQFDALSDSYYNASSANASSSGRNPQTYDLSYSASIGVEPERSFVTQFPTWDTRFYAMTPNPSYPSMVSYYANVWNPPDFGIASISAIASAQQTQNLDTLGVTDLELGYLPLYIVPVTLRGQTFYAQIEGVSVTADTNDSRFTYYLTPIETSAFFTLDSNLLGVLDSNRLAPYNL